MLAGLFTLHPLPENVIFQISILYSNTILSPHIHPLIRNFQIDRSTMIEIFLPLRRLIRVCLALLISITPPGHVQTHNFLATIMQFHIFVL